jgi:uncharacterized protein (DUF2062 family)/2-polyprenyl-3-methyl-5-hydroxy-6-metoxy-1,4-benzoquinol methylase
VAGFSLLREEVRRAWRELRGGELSPARGAIAVAIGLFIGTQPIFGCHTPLVLIFCLWFRLDAAVAWVAANISNPFFAPFLLWAEVEVGAYLATGTRLGLRQGIGAAEAWSAFPGYMFLGAPVIGLGLAALGGAAAYGVLSLRRRRTSRIEPYRLPDDAPPWVHAVERVASRYCPPEDSTPAQRTRFHYVRIKLLTDPAPRLIAGIAGDEAGALGELIDIGTGAGQLPILLLELGLATRARGVDWDAAKIDDARRAAALSPALPAEFERADAREAALGEADTVLLIDLLHYFRCEEQDAILRRAAAAVRPGGRLLVREADPSRGVRSWATLIEERVFTALRFNRGERVRFRPSRELAAILEGTGLRCETRPAWGRTPFSNVLIIATRPAEERGEQALEAAEAARLSG